MNFTIAADHRGLDLKSKIKNKLEALGHSVEDFGTNSTESCDYPDFAFPAAEKVGKGEVERGILICSTGIGMSIIGNKVKNVRASLCTNVHQAEMTRQHNNSNVLVLAADELPEEKNLEILDAWLTNDFEGGRHQRRVSKIHDLTQN